MKNNYQLCAGWASLAFFVISLFHAPWDKTHFLQSGNVQSITMSATAPLWNPPDGTMPEYSLSWAKVTLRTDLLVVRWAAIANLYGALYHLLGAIDDPVNPRIGKSESRQLSPTLTEAEVAQTNSRKEKHVYEAVTVAAVLITFAIYFAVRDNSREYQDHRIAYIAGAVAPATVGAWLFYWYRRKS